VFCAFEKEKNTNVSSECNRQPHVMVYIKAQVQLVFWSWRLPNDRTTKH